MYGDTRNEKMCMDQHGSDLNAAFVAYIRAKAEQAADGTGDGAFLGVFRSFAQGLLRSWGS